MKVIDKQVLQPIFIFFWQKILPQNILCHYEMLIMLLRVLWLQCLFLFSNHLKLLMGFPGGSGGKESTCNAGDLGSISGLQRSPGGGHGNPLQYSCLENPHGQRRLVDCSPWGCKESDITEWLSTAQHKALNTAKNI